MLIKSFAMQLHIISSSRWFDKSYTLTFLQLPVFKIKNKTEKSTKQGSIVVWGLKLYTTV